MNKKLKWALIIISGSILIIFFLLVYMTGNVFSFNDDGPLYSKQDLINNYIQKQQNIYKLRDYYNKLIPANKIVDIEFKSNKELGRLFIQNLNDTSTNNNYKYFEDWDLDINSPKVDSILHALNWSTKTLNEIKQRLDSANCISIKNGEPTNIGFQRSGMGMYYYNLFTKPLSDSLKERYNNNNCNYIQYDSTVVLEYGGGVYGPQCFQQE
jgi:hypothetical protein